jgi:hypothetical protein
MSRNLWWVFAMLGLGCGTDYKLGAAATSFVVSPDLSDLGVVNVGDTVPFVVTISNTGGAELSLVAVEIININGDYLARSDAEIPGTILGGEFADLIFNYIPETDGYHHGRIILKTDASEDPDRTIEVRGQASTPTMNIWPSVIDFGPVLPGTAAVETVTMVNTGTTPIDIVELPVDNGVFLARLTLPFRVEPGEKIDVPFEFVPIDLTEQTGDAVVLLGGGQNLAGLHLRGNACSTAAGELYDQDGDGYSVCGSDCDDRDDLTHPGAREVCNGIDDNCDGTVDETTPCFDDDGDGQTEEEGDCNDADAAVHSGAEEDMANGIDDDCDGVVDSGASDFDGDGYSAAGGDCAPYDSSVHPGATEWADGLDNDCDGIVDEGTDFYDDDGDGYTELEGDCDDTDERISPYRVEVADWLDNDCDGMVDEGTIHADDDGDGFSELGGDCDDANPAVNPGHPEIPGDGLDNNCDGVMF